MSEQSVWYPYKVPKIISEEEGERFRSTLEIAVIYEWLRLWRQREVLSREFRERGGFGDRDLGSKL